ncbi:MAG: 4Fe-4S dicluster domain-containing protein [Chloroflexi bacterium]|jgi:Fe-S-cluster-containing hydrogenase component 2|nr:4Fe-4S dicluster domain-containing protein [Chloroflexota bacterium]
MTKEQQETPRPSRRVFLKGLGVGVAAGIAASVGGFGIWTALEKEEVRVVPTPTPVQPPPPTEAHQQTAAAKELPQRAAGRIQRVAFEENACISCGTCSLVCSTVHEGASSNAVAGIWLERHPFECEYDLFTCEQCDAPECYLACETEGAFYIDETTGARAINAEKCRGCGRCLRACPLNPPRIQYDAQRHVAVKCDLCAGRPEGPACVEFCPQQALTLVTKEGPRA